MNDLPQLSILLIKLARYHEKKLEISLAKEYDALAERTIHLNKKYLLWGQNSSMQKLARLRKKEEVTILDEARKLIKQTHGEKNTCKDISTICRQPTHLSSVEILQTLLASESLNEDGTTEIKNLINHINQTNKKLATWEKVASVDKMLKIGQVIIKDSASIYASVLTKIQKSTRQQVLDSLLARNNELQREFKIAKQQQDWGGAAIYQLPKELVQEIINFNTMIENYMSQLPQGQPESPLAANSEQVKLFLAHLQDLKAKASLVAQQSGQPRIAQLVTNLTDATNQWINDSQAQGTFFIGPASGVDSQTGQRVTTGLQDKWEMVLDPIAAQANTPIYQGNPAQQQGQQGQQGPVNQQAAYQQVAQALGNLAQYGNPLAAAVLQAINQQQTTTTPQQPATGEETRLIHTF